ncbi:MAG: glycosyltransferase family 39 protein [Proteobacteria bacterium]|nr:glycosyltransferase family 39 protein [Pseudomonadota bacterium]
MQERVTRGRFVVAATFVVLFGAALRVLYVATAQAEPPVYGDGVQYMAYAWNLLHNGVFSCSPPGSASIVADGYRGPGYPLLLAAALELGRQDIRVVLDYVCASQVLLGSATVGLTIALARTWLGRGLSLLAGALIACWPHLITFCAAVMSETLFGFLLVSGCLLLVHGVQRAAPRLLALSGLVFGAAYLVNPIVLFFPFLAALAVMRRTHWRHAAVLAACFAIAPAAWSLRDANLPMQYGASRRAIENFVQGSMPLYMRAFNSRWVSPDARRIVDATTAETELMFADPAAGVLEVLGRMRQQPWTYTSWYLLEKPWQLWAWPIVIGSGDIYYPPTRDSPFERIQLLKGMRSAFEWMNPAIFASAMLMMTLVLRRVCFRAPTSVTAGILVLFVVYVTLIHMVFQAEPRYAIPYRPFEVVLALGGMVAVAKCLRGRRHDASPKPGGMDAGQVAA